MKALISSQVRACHVHANGAVPGFREGFYASGSFGEKHGT